MKAFYTYGSGLVNPIKTSHSNVIELPKTRPQREFKCLDCGAVWIENINSPQIVSEADFVEFKTNYQPCNK